AADDSGNVFLATGDGWFDAAHVPAGDVANSIVKIGLAHEVPTHNLLAHDRLPLLDYFTPFNQAKLSRHDQDLGSGGVLLARDPGDGHRQLLIHVGKEGTLYILDSNAFTAKNLHYCDGCGSDTQIMQELPLAIPGGVWGIPAYWNGRIYVSGSSDPVRAFSLRNGLVDASVLSSTQEVFRYPGAGLAISSEGAKNAILWTLEVGAYDSKGPAILRAYDATDLSSLLYASDRQAERDQAGGAVKFTVPTVVNGKVYVGGASQLTVFGSLSTAPSHLAAH
ncbi:MAG TPA: hypothetical protein VKZ53_00245, partial [Candidatus Angelobacter sp.]|nr:hypothetical protein [Candidatus Angelobacter sp.]